MRSALSYVIPAAMRVLFHNDVHTSALGLVDLALIVPFSQDRDIAFIGWTFHWDGDNACPFSLGKQEAMLFQLAVLEFLHKVNLSFVTTNVQIISIVNSNVQLDPSNSDICLELALFGVARAVREDMNSTYRDSIIASFTAAPLLFLNTLQSESVAFGNVTSFDVISIELPMTGSELATNVQPAPPVQPIASNAGAQTVDILFNSICILIISICILSIAYLFSRKEAGKRAEMIQRSVKEVKSHGYCSI